MRRTQGHGRFHGRPRRVGPHGWGRWRVSSIFSAASIGDIQALEGLHVYCDFHCLIKSVLTKFKGPRRIQAWQGALPCSTALVLLASLLWFAPWQGRHDGPATVPQSMPLQDSDRRTEATATPTTQPLVAPTSEAGSLPSAPMPRSSEQSHTSATSEEPTEVLDTQDMQRLVTHLEAARSAPAEHLDARAMDHLLARLESADKTGSPPSPRSKVVRKRGVRELPRAGDHGAPAVSHHHAMTLRLSVQRRECRFPPLRDKRAYRRIRTITLALPLKERTHAHTPCTDHTSRISAF